MNVTIIVVESPASKSQNFKEARDLTKIHYPTVVRINYYFFSIN